MKVHHLNRFLAAAACLLALAVLAAACGGSSKNSDNTKDVNVQAGTPVEQPTATPLAGEAATAVARGVDPEYVSFSDPKGRFTAEVPRGWPVSNDVNGSIFALPATDQPVAASITISCMPGLSADGVVAQDQRIAANVAGGRLAVDQQYQVAIAGGSITARAIPWPGDPNKLGLDQLNYYFDAAGCGWKIGLHVFLQDKISQLMPVLQHVADSFRLTGQ